MAQYPAGWTGEMEREFQATLRPKTPEGWSPEAEAAYQDQFGADAIDYANQGVRSLGRGTLNAVADVTGLGGQALRQMGVDPSFLPAENVSQGFRSAAGAIPDVPIVQDAPSGVAKFVSTTGADALGQALPGMATMGAGAAARLGTRAVGFLGAGLGAAQGATQGGREAAQYGASNAEQWGAFLLNGGLSMADAIVPSKILARLDEATGGGIKKAALSIVADGTQGGGIEMLQQAGLDAYAKGTFDPERDILGSVGEAGAGGGFASTVLSVLGQVAGVAKARGIKKGEAAPPSATDSATFTEEPVEQPFGNSEGLDLTGVQSEPLGDKLAKLPTTGAAPLPVTSPSGDAGAAATYTKEITPEHIASVKEGKRDVTLVAEDGSPVVLYRGTAPGNADVFRPATDGAAGPGTYLSLSEQKAKNWASIHGGEHGQVHSGTVSGRFLRIPYGEDVRARHWNALARDLGYDGLFVSGQGEVVVFDKSKITPIAQPQAVEPAPDAGSRREQTPAALPKADGEPLDARDPESTPDRTDTLPGEQGYLQEAVKRAAPEASSEADTVGLRHEDTAKYRAERGLGEYEGRQGGLSDVDRHAKAVETFKADPHAGRKLVERLAETGEAGSDQDAALLLLEEHRTRLEVEAAEKAYTENPTAENKAAVDKSFADFKRTMDVMDQAGSEGGARLRAQRDRIKYDYSFAAQLRKREVANGGEPLSTEERATLKKETDAVAKAAKAAEEAATTAERERRIKALESAVAELQRRGTVRTRQRERTRGVDRARKELADVWGEWKRRTSVARTGISTEDVAILGKLAAKTIKLGFNTFAKFSAELKDHLDESLHKTAWNAGLKVHRDELAEPIADRLKAGAKLTELRAYIDGLAESFYSDGVTDSDKLADAVHGVLKVADPSITREQTVAAISHYGEFKQLSQEEPAKGLRTIRGELRETAKLADLANGIPPKKTGVEYPEPSGKQRRLAKQVRDKMKALGIRVTDSATQLKSALESAKTRARNRIDDLTTAIDTRTQIKNGERVAVSDAELVELKAKRAELEKVYADLFVGPKDDPKIRTLVDSIADLDKRIAAGDTSTRGPKQGPEPRADIAALKLERAEKAKTLVEMRKAADAKTQAERIADQVKKLETRRDALKGKLFDAGEGGSVAPTGGKQGPDVARVAELKAEIASLNETIGDIRDAQNPKLSDEARATASHERRAARRLADTQAVMRSGKFEKVTVEKEERIKSPTEIETLTELELAKRIVDRGRYETEQRNRTLAKKIVDNAIAQPMREVKAALASADVSAVGRQGWALTVQDLMMPWRWPQLSRRLGRMFHALVSEKTQRLIETEIVNDPSYRDLKKAGVEFTGINDPLTPQEEYFQSKWLESIPYAGQIIKGSERGFVTYMNLLRLQHGKRMIRGSDGSKESLKQIARTINVFSGRANVKPGTLKSLMHGVSPALWAPSLYTSRFQFVLLEPLYGGNRQTRLMVAKEYASTLGALASIYALIGLYNRMSDDDEKDKPTVSWDPSSPDYAKVRIGDTRIDITAGLGGTARLIQRETKAFWKLSFDEGKERKQAEDPLRVAEDFFEYKFAPGVTVPFEIVTGKELATFREKPRPQNVQEALARIAPLSFRETHEAMVEQGVPAGVAYAVLSAFGFGLQTYEDNKK